MTASSRFWSTARATAADDHHRRQLLLYAYNADAPQQKASVQWLQELIKSGEIIGLPWVTLWAFIRISTNSRIWANPKSAKEAFAIVGGRGVVANG